MILNRTKLAYLASVVSLIFPPKTLFWNKTKFPTSDLVNLTELVVKELIKSISKQNNQYPFFYPIYHCLMQRFQGLITEELDNFTKILISIVFY